MHSFTDIHESRDLKQARLSGQYVDLLRLHARYSLIGTYVTLPLLGIFVNTNSSRLKYVRFLLVIIDKCIGNINVLCQIFIPEERLILF